MKRDEGKGRGVEKNLVGNRNRRWRSRGIGDRDYPWMASWDRLPREKEDRELEGYTRGRGGRGGWGGSCIAEAAVEANGNAEEEERIPLWWHSSTRRSEKLRRSWASLAFSSSPILWPATTPFIGTPGIIRSEFVFSRPCAVLAVGVSSIRPATDYWTKTRG